MRRSGWIPIAIAALLLALGGCAEKKGDDGKTGPAGPAGEAATITVQAAAAEACAACHGDGQYADVIVGNFHGVTPPNQPVDFDTEITAVTVSAANEITVELTVYLAGTATPVTNLINKDIRFTLAKVVPAASSASKVDEWVSYFVGQTTATQNLATYQGTNPSGSSGALALGGTFTNVGAGVYTWKFGDGVSAAKVFTADLGKTLRVGAQVSVSTTTASVPYPYGGRSVTNGWADFVLTTNTAQTLAAKGPLNATGTPTNHIVDTASCNECHQALAMHGGGRRNVEFCETCHNGGNGGTAYTNKDSNGNSIDFKQMLHKVHYGKELPSVLAGGTYGIVGYSGTVIDFSTGTFPQTMTNCEKCHGSATGLTYTTAGGDVIAGLATQANWKTQASVEACTSCHDRTSFAATVPTGYTAHSGGADGSANVPNLEPATCQGCHGSTVGGTDPKQVPNAHPWAQRVAEAVTWKFDLISAAYSSTSKKATVVFEIENPVGTPTDFTSGTAGSPPWMASGSSSRLRIRIATKDRGGADYTNKATSDGADPGSPLVYDLLGTLPTGATLSNSTNTFTLVTEDISAKIGSAGTGMVTLEGHPAKSIGGNTLTIPVVSAIKEFRIGDTPSAGIPRRAVVDTGRCDDCHGDASRFAAGALALSMHGANRNFSATSGIGVCVACHNSANTDIDGHDSSLDGLKEQAIDMKFMIHRIHKGRDLESGSFQIGEDTFAGEFPPGRMLNNCQNCHFANLETIPAYAGGGTFGKDANQLPLVGGIEGTTVDSGTSLTDHSDDLNMSPNSAACSGCHDGDGAKNHMILMGGSFIVKEADIEFY